MLDRPVRSARTVSFARGDYVGKGRAAVLVTRERADIARMEELDRDRLRLLRDGFMEMLSGRGLTQAQIGFVFNRHPEHVGRILREAPDGLVETAHAILQGRVPSTE